LTFFIFYVILNIARSKEVINLAIRSTHKCHICKEVFRNEEMVNYASPRSKTAYWYCKKCYEDKLAQNNFSDKVCSIFGVKAPGPQIWTERKRLIDNYGYSDETIINCLDYVYNVLRKPKKSVTLYFVNPSMVDEMMKYRRKQKVQSLNLAAALQTEVREYVVPIKENTSSRKKIMYDPDEWLDD